jgi:hypothetical protein
LELVLSRPPVTISLESKPRDEDLAPMTAKQEFLQRLKTLRELAGGNLHRAQVRYKRGYDDSVRETNRTVVAGDDVYVRAESPVGDQHSKLDSPVQGPYRVESNDGRTMLLRLGDESVRVSSDRITRAPRSGHQTPPTEPVGHPRSVPASSDEYVVERVVDHKANPSGGTLFRVRWYGHQDDEDTWEPEEGIPSQFIRRYWRSKRTAN